MSSNRRGWFSGALIFGVLGVLSWFAPFDETVYSRKGGAMVAAFDAVIQPLIDAAGNVAVAVMFGAVALFMLWRGLGLGLSRFRRERPEQDIEEPPAPLQRKRDLSRLAVTDETTPYTQPENQAEADPESPLPPSEAEPPVAAEQAAPANPPAVRANPFATERAHVEYLAACHGFDENITRDAMQKSYRKLLGPDAELGDALYEKALALVREQQRRTTPHGQRVDPVALVRKPRERERDWTGDCSWFGGLPRLGDATWPVGADGVALPFAAQIDLGEIAAACPHSPLPHIGSLAFFLNKGAVVYVEPGEHPVTPAPPGLPPAYNEGGGPLPERVSRVSREAFPFWPIEAIGLRLPEGLPEPSDDSDAIDEIQSAQAEALHAIVPPRKYFFSAGEDAPGADKLWWYGADYVLRQLADSCDYVDRAVALREKWIADAHGYQARLAAEIPPNAAKIAESQKGEERNRDAIPAIRRQGESLREFIEHFKEFVAGKEPWDEMSGAEIAVLQEALGEARTQFPDLCTYHVPRAIKDVRTICVRRMITGDAAALAALPDDLLDHLNSGYRLATENQHQMFGVGGCQQSALHDHLCDHLLLQIGPDEIAELNFPDMGIWQFWISPEDLDARRWDKATLTFECG